MGTMTDSERKHGLYGEPWTIYEGDANGRKYFIQGADAETEFGRIIAGMDFRGDDYLSRTDVWCRMRRAAQCVNACEGIDDPTAELTRLRARIEELEAVCQSLQEDVGHAMATANHREDQRAAAVERYKKAEQRVAELERVVEAARDVASYFEDQHDDLCDQERTKVGECFCHVPELVAAVAALDAAEGEK